LIFRFNNNFKRHDLHNGTLWLAGWIDKPLGELNYKFADHEILKLRGQFGLVWQGKDGWWLAQCDHLCTYPLWYCEELNELYAQWSDVPASETDEIFYAQRDILHGQMTVGSRTPYKNTERVQPDHALDRGTQVRYNWSIDVTSTGPEKDTWQDILLEAIKTNCSDGDVLLLSGGRDSTTIANTAHYLGIELVYAHVTQGKPNPDTECVKQFAENKNIKINYLNPWEYNSEFNEYNYWHDSSYNPKRTCLQILNAQSGLTGELGASESGSKKINTILQMPDITIEQLTNIWITTLEKRNESVASPLVHDDYTEWAEQNYHYASAYREIVEHHEQQYKYFKEQTNDNHQLLKAAIMLHAQDHEAYRLHNYSQDIQYTWKHPFSHPDWFDIIWNTPIETRKLHYHNREVYRIATQGCDWFDYTAWNYGGPRGLSQ